MTALGASLLSPISCATGRPRPSLADALAPHVDTTDVAANPQLLARLRGTAHGYFRFINVPFSQAVCERFADLSPVLPVVNLHGDAHVEQYAVTSLGRGLTDFDDSSTGPFVIDLLRFGVSLRLAAEARGWRHDEEAILDAFFRGYRSALRDPLPPSLSRPSWRACALGSRATTRAASTDSLMGAPVETSAILREAEREYSDGLLAERPALPKTFFDIKKSGALRMGIGSALDRKYLVRVEGPTSSDDDDVLIEAKEVKDISMIGCVTAPAGADRILAGHSRIANQPLRLRGLPARRWDDVLAPRVARRLCRGDRRGAALGPGADRDRRRRRGADGTGCAALSPTRRRIPSVRR